MAWRARTAMALVVAIPVLAGCSTAPGSREARDDLVRRAAAALKDLDRETPGVALHAQRSYAYAIFPEVAKAGIGLGAAYGRGVVYEQGEHIGYADVTHGSVGLQLGGQAYQELVVFENRAALDRFKGSPLDFSADASGVAVTTGYAADVRFVEGTTVFMRPIGGAMAEASMGIRRFTFILASDRR